jgi:hypothetical protein
VITHPTAAELAQAVAAFDAEAAAPGDARHAFLSRVADNARAVLAREADKGAGLQAEATGRLKYLLGETSDFETLNRQLCLALRNGQLSPLDPGVLAHLKATAIGQIAIDQPTYGGLAALLDVGGGA